MGTMSKGSEHEAQLGLTEHGSSGHVWETHTHAHTKPLKGQEWTPRRVWNGGQTWRRGRGSEFKE